MKAPSNPMPAAPGRRRWKPWLAVRSLIAAALAILIWLCIDEGKDAAKAILKALAAAGRGRLAEAAGPDPLDGLAGNLVQLCMAALGLAAASYVVLRLTPKLIRPQIRAKSGSDLEPRPVVILIMSRPDRTDDQLQAILAHYRTLDIKDVVYDESAMSLRFPWQHSLRALWRHIAPDRETLVYVIFSREITAHLTQFRAFVALLAEKSGARIDVREAPGCPISFDNFAECERAIGDLVHDLAIRRGAPFRAKDISLDVTGGTKMTGIAAAVISMNRDLEFSYVPNNYSSLNPTPVVFDAHLETIDIKKIDF